MDIDGDVEHKRARDGAGSSEEQQVRTDSYCGQHVQQTHLRFFAGAGGSGENSAYNACGQHNKPTPLRQSSPAGCTSELAVSNGNAMLQTMITCVCCWQRCWCRL